MPTAIATGLSNSERDTTFRYNAVTACITLKCIDLVKKP
jgi:hypothetical protein